MRYLRRTYGARRTFTLLAVGLLGVVAPAFVGTAAVGSDGASVPDAVGRSARTHPARVAAPVRAPVVPRLEARLALGRAAVADATRVVDDLGSRAAGGIGSEDIRGAAEVLDVDLGERIDGDAVSRLSEAHARALPVFASVAGVEMRLPSYRTVLVGFHQASFAPARQMSSHNASLVDMTILPSRGRPTGRRSAVDVAVLPDTPVMAPVSGRVVEVKRYALYGRYPDVRIRIVPAADTSMLVTVLHVTGAHVRVGDRVSAGETVLADHATQFPFASQIDRFAGRHPHVHIEVRGR